MLTNMDLPKERRFFIAVLYKDCSLQFAYRGFFRELTNMNLPKERWCMENLLLPGHLQHPDPLCAHIFCKHIINIYEKCSKACTDLSLYSTENAQPFLPTLEIYFDCICWTRRAGLTYLHFSHI